VCDQAPARLDGSKFDLKDELGYLKVEKNKGAYSRGKS
jgi:hypothetical protein